MIGTVRFYRNALIASVVLNVLLVVAIWLYVHFAGLYSTIDTLMGIID